MTHIVDNLLTNRYLGFPLFLFIIWLMFEVTFSIGQYPMDWIDSGISALGGLITSNMAEGPLKAMLVDGRIGEDAVAEHAHPSVITVRVQTHYGLPDSGALQTDLG